jgi:hypothetical protein
MLPEGVAGEICFQQYLGSEAHNQGDQDDAVLLDQGRRQIAATVGHQPYRSGHARRLLEEVDVLGRWVQPFFQAV